MSDITITNDPSEVYGAGQPVKGPDGVIQLFEEVIAGVNSKADADALTATDDAVAEKSDKSDFSDADLNRNGHVGVIADESTPKRAIFGVRIYDGKIIGPWAKAVDAAIATFQAALTKTDPVSIKSYPRSGVAWAVTDPSARRSLWVSTAGQVFIGRSNVSEFIGRNFQTQLDAITALINGSGKVVTLGDSVDFGTGSDNAGLYSMYARMALEFPATDAKSISVGGSDLRQQAALFGAIPVSITSAAAEVPASGALTLTTVDPGFMYVPGGGSRADVSGELAGVKGVMTQASGVYTFTRSESGSEVPLTVVNSFFVADTQADEFHNRIVVIGGGINNSEADQADGVVVDLMQRIVDKIAPLTKRFVVLTVLNSTAETSGTNGYNAIAACNARIKARWPLNYYDRRAQLVAAFDPGEPADVIANGSDTPPPSLLDDTIHPNNNGHGVMYDGLKEFMTLKGWL